MSSFKIIPKVNEAKEFMEIASDFGGSLELVREAISNSFDARATRIRIAFSTRPVRGIHFLRIVIEDNGSGMSKDDLQAFFDLGNSRRHHEKMQGGGLDSSLPIGEKGHGTKVYFNSNRIEVVTSHGGAVLRATLDEPYGHLSDGQIPHVQVDEIDPSSVGEFATTITIDGYNHNQTELFNHERVKDYVLWFTKFGSCEAQFGLVDSQDVELELSGLDRSGSFEKLRFGHPFPPESAPLAELFDKYDERAPDYFSKRYVRKGSLPRLPQFEYRAVLSIEGQRVKLDANKMIRRQGRAVPPQGAYTVAERYGIWLCKDFIPVERRNEPVTAKGSEWTRLHAFFNCQAIRLSANRGSIQPTPENIKNSIDEEIRRLYDEIMAGDDMDMLDWFAEEADARKTIAQEAKDLKKREERSERAGVATLKGVVLVEPNSEVGVLALMAQLSILEPQLFPFTVLDYDSHAGFDVLAKGDHTTPIQDARKFFVEYKFTLGPSFNHSFQNLKSIVCWSTKVKQDEEIADIANKKRVLAIRPPKDAKDTHTRYFLDDPGEPLKIEVFVLKTYLKERLSLEFKPRDGAQAR